MPGGMEKKIPVNNQWGEKTELLTSNNQTIQEI